MAFTLTSRLQLPDSFHDFILKLTDKKGASSQLLTHVRRELMHKVWETILDNDFLKAWDLGILVKCGDGITRRLYPRIFTYSADYPEK